MKVAAIHQPIYIPWLGYFYKIANADIFVLLDNVQLSLGRGYGSRNSIKTSNGEIWLTVPCKKKKKGPQLNYEVEIDNSSNWRRKHSKSFHHYYSKAPYYKEYKYLLDIYQDEWTKLINFNTQFIMGIKKALKLSTPVAIASRLEVEGSNTDLLIDICKKVGADTYLSGAGGFNYQDESKFKDAAIKLVYSKFSYPIYDQLWGDFIPNLSVLDTLFNCGSRTVDFLKKDYYEDR